MDLLADNRVISYIVPNKLISAPYTEALRKNMGTKQVLEIRDYSNVNVFKTAAVYRSLRINNCDQRTPVIMDVMEDMETILNHNLIEPDKFYADINWDKYFNTNAGALEIVDKMSEFPALGTIATVNGAATVGEAYLVKEYLLDDDSIDDVIKFINTGGIDKYKSFHGVEPIRYLKGKYTYPVAKASDVEKCLQNDIRKASLRRSLLEV